MRLPDWEPRLGAYLDSVAARAFEYGRHDCALHVAAAVQAMTGSDFGAPFRGRYRSAAGAVRALRLYGAGSLDDTLATALGSAQPLAWAHRGDVCAYGEAVGILLADCGLFVGRGDGDPELFGLGLVTIPRYQLDRERSWPVPFG